MSLGFKIYSMFNGNLVGKDPLGNSFYTDKKKSSKRWVIYMPGFGPDSLLPDYHNWIHNTSDIFPLFDNDIETSKNTVKQRIKKHSLTKNSSKKGYISWQPK